MIWIGVILTLNALIPTKWLRVAGVPLGDCISIVIYAVYVVRATVSRRRVARQYLPWILCLIAVAISGSIAALSLHDSEALLIVLRQVYHYLFIVPLYCEIKTLKQYATVLKVYVAVSLVATIGLHIYHHLPYLANPEFGEASFRGLIGGEARVFTPGMGYVLITAVGLMVLLTDSRLKTLSLVVALEAFLLSGLVWTYTRTFFVVLAVCLCVEVALTAFSRRQVKRFVVLLSSLVLLCVVAATFTSELGALFSRLDSITSAATDFERDADTVAWRVAEAKIAVESMSGVLAFAFGTFAGRFSFREYVGFSPHIGWIGMFYHFGAVGAAAFVAMFIVLIRRLFRQFRLYRTSSNRFLRLVARSHILFLIAFALLTFGGGSFATSSTIIALGLLWHGAAVIEKVRLDATVLSTPRSLHSVASKIVAV